ncbi:hypothetical protein HMPREF3223_01859 [Cutibacterium avidum]|nr:hypothetical protein HMPREF3223_01859 [Cutibacterium avidum]
MKSAKQLGTCGQLPAASSRLNANLWTAPTATNHVQWSHHEPTA